MRPLILSQVFNLCLFQLLDLSSKCRNYFIQIANYAVISNVEDVGILILVDSDDAVRAAHACYVLDSAGDTASDVKLRSNGLAGLAYLVSMCDPAAVNSSDTMMSAPSRSTISPAASSIVSRMHVRMSSGAT